MKSQKNISKIVFISLVGMAQTVRALPSGEEVVSGAAEFARPSQDTCVITPSNRAIIEYQSFNIAEQERVEFVQPSTDATVLNRIVSSSPSSILGKMEANGKVFFVNPHGVYFGKDAQVHVGSLVVSTLDISDKDFLSDRFVFQGDNKSGSSSIINEGHLRASPEGAIVLMASHIQNRGVITAKLGSVAMLAGDHITLDFHGDGLMSFAVEAEDIESAVIEQCGKVLAEAGNIALRLPVARKMVQQVVNRDSVVEGNRLVFEEGRFRIVHEGISVADQIALTGKDGSHVSVLGRLCTDNPTGVGGLVHILGEKIELFKATILSSGSRGGGNVFIGGDYQGLGELHQAQELQMDIDSKIIANAMEEGNGGEVVLWSKGATLFNGKVEALGGANGGNGGRVETSGKARLGMQKGRVNTTAPFGEIGEWLLDPGTIVISNSGSTDLVAAANCASAGIFTLDVSAINSALSDVTLCASTRFEGTEVINMTNLGVGITFQQGGVSPVEWGYDQSITTNNGFVVFQGDFAMDNASVTVVTNGGAAHFFGEWTNNSSGSTLAIDVATSGGDITFDNAIDVIGASSFDVTLDASGGTVVFQAVADVDSLIVNGNEITQMGDVNGLGNIAYTAVTQNNLGGNITTADSNVTLTGPTVLTSSVTIDSGTGIGDITMEGIEGSAPGNESLTLEAGTGNVSITGAIGSTVALDTLEAFGAILTQSSNVTANGGVTYTGVTRLDLGGSITTVGGDIDIDGPVRLTSNATINSGPGATGIINFSSTVDGSTSFTESITTNSGTSNTNFDGNIGSITPLNAIVVNGVHDFIFSGLLLSANTFTQSAQDVGGLTHFSGTVLLSNPIASIDAFFFDGEQLTLAGGLTTSAAASDAGHVMIQNADTLTIAGGATLQIRGDFQQAGVGAVSIIDSITTLSSDITFSGPVTLLGTITLDASAGGGDISVQVVDGATSGAQSLTMNAGAGNVSMTGAIGSIAALDMLEAFGDIVTQSSNVTANGGVTYTGATRLDLGGNITTVGGAVDIDGPVRLTSNIIVDSGPGATGIINFSSTVDGSTSFVESITTNSGMSNTNFDGSIGSTTPLDAIFVNGVHDFTFSGLLLSANTFTQSAQDVGGLTHFAGIVLLSNPTAGTDAFFFDGEQLTLAGGLTTSAAASNAGHVMIQNADTLTIAGGATLQIRGDFQQAGVGAVSIIDSITTLSSDIIFSGPVTLLGSITLDASAGGGSISVQIVNGTTSGSESLGMHAGTGNVSILGAVGGTVPLDMLEAFGDIVTQSSNVTANGGVTYTGATRLDLGGNITTAGGAVDIDGPVRLTNSISVDSGPGATGIINFSSTVDGSTSSTESMTANSGLADTNFSGAVGGTVPLDMLEAFADIVTQSSNVSADGGVTYTGATRLDLGGNIITMGGAVDIDGPVRLTSNIIVDSGPGATGIINFSSTVDGSTSFVESITTSSGMSNTNFDGSIGSTTPLDAIFVNGVHDFTFSGLLLSANTFTQSAQDVGGLTHFAGTVLLSNPIAGTDAFFFDGEQLTLAGGLTTSAAASDAGHVMIQNADTLTIAGGATLQIRGDFEQLGMGAVSIIDSITTLSSDIIFSGPVTLLGSITLDASAGGGDIVVQMVDGTTSGSQSLTMNAGTGNVNITGAIGGAVPLDMLEAFGDIVMQSSSVTANGGITYTGATRLDLGGSMTTAGGDIDIDGPVRLTSNLVIDSGPGAAGIINFSSTVDGSAAFTESITVDSGMSDINFDADVGSTTPLDVITVNQAGTLIFSGLTTASNFIQIAQSAGGLTGFVGPLSLSNSAVGTDALSFDGEVLAFLGGLDTSGSAAGAGNVSIKNSDILFSQGAAIQVRGDFTQSGFGPVLLGDSITTLSSDITFLGPVVLLNSVTLDTSSGFGNIHFGDTLDGDSVYQEHLTLIAGSSGTPGQSTITFNGFVGSGVELGNILIQSCRDSVGIATINALSYVQSNGSGNTTLLGDLELAGNADITTLGNIQVTAVNTTNNSANGDISLQPQTGFTSSPSLGQLPNGTIQIGGDLNAGTGNINLALASRALPGDTLSVASIFNDSVATPLQFTCQDLTTGENEIFTSFSAVAITCSGTVEIGDLVTLGGITINAPTILLISHTNATTLAPDGRIGVSPDPGAHLVSSQPIVTSVFPMLTGSGVLLVTEDSTLTTADLLFSQPGQTFVLNALDAPLPPINPGGGTSTPQVPVRDFYEPLSYQGHNRQMYPDFLNDLSTEHQVALYYTHSKKTSH